MITRYDKYKDSGVEWIGEIPEGWKVCRFKNFMTLVTNSSDSDMKIGLENIESGTGRYIKTDTVFEGNGVGFEKADIVYGKLRPYLQKVWLAEFDGNAIGDCFIFRAKANSYPTFIKYLLLSDGVTKEADGSTFGAKMPRVSSEFILTLPFYLPTVDEQLSISNYLDAQCTKIDNIIATQEKRVELLKELKQSIITHAVTRGINPDVKLKDSGVEWIGRIPEHWQLMKIKHICKSEPYSCKTGPFGTQLKGDDLKPQGDIRVYNQRNVIDNRFDTVNFFVTNQKAESLSSFYTKPGDLLITSRGTIGRCAILPDDIPMGILHPCLIALRIDNRKCLTKWLRLFINESDAFSTNIFLNSNATTIEVIYTETLKNVNIVIPSVEEQEYIIKVVEEQTAKLDSSISKALRQIELLKEYKQSLITEVVTGKRKVC